jgi:di/tricarboxylate transporter
MSNAAAALVVLPIALQAADTLGVSRRAFAIAALARRSPSYAVRAVLHLVYGPGKYCAGSSVSAGLTLLLVVVVLALLPVFWPLG